MSDDAIRAALDAAVDAAVRRFAALPDEMRVRDCRWHIHAAAIAAFLRALPDPFSPAGYEVWRTRQAHEDPMLWLAAAVERAAQEDTR